jgi:hypothetical protein
MKRYSVPIRCFLTTTAMLTVAVQWANGQAFSDADWTSMGGIPGVDDPVYAVAVDDSGNVYVGGDFTIAGNGFASRIAKWDGNAWSALGSGMNGRVQALAVSGTNLYAGGNFTTAGGAAINYIAKWDGSAWSPLVSGMNAQVRALVVSGGNLYAAGDFTTAGGVPANRIAKWDGHTWSTFGSGMDGPVRALAISGAVLYAGGSFTNAGGNVANNIAVWSGGMWSPLGMGMDGPVDALALYGTDLYAGGEFVNADWLLAYGIAKWDGFSWSPLWRVLNCNVFALAVYGTNLCVGGALRVTGVLNNQAIALWDGSTWSALDDETRMGSVYALAVSGTNLYAGFSVDICVAKWNGIKWSAFGSGITGGVSELAVSGTNVYATGGDLAPSGSIFVSTNGLAAVGIAKWDGSSWSGLASGVGGHSVLAMSGADLYAAGDSFPGGAKWEGNWWSPLGSQVNISLYSLALAGPNLYAGAVFSDGAGNSTNAVVKWNGSAWSPIGWMVGGSAWGGPPWDSFGALALSDTDLFVGGDFTNIEGVVANSTVKWDGVVWSALGSGIEVGSVYQGIYALAVSGTDLYAGGDFTVAGGTAANNIAKWDGTTWSPLGSGMNGEVLALAISGTNLYAGGNFTVAGGIAANFVAKWDGQAWSPLGSGMNNAVFALVTDGTNLYAGGDFTVAGNKVCGYIAKANISGQTSAAGGRFTRWAFAPGTGFTCIFAEASPGLPYRIQTSPSLLDSSWTDLTNFTYTGPITITDTSALFGSRRFYRAVSP